MIGKTIKIINMEGEPQYSGKIGVVKTIDSMGQLHGTWGGLAINKEVDEYIVICPICKQKIDGFPAICRRSNVEICSDCGTIQAILDFIGR